MALDKHEDRMLLAGLFEKLPELSNTFDRRSLIEELNLDPNEFQVDEGNAHTFAVSFVALLHRQGRQEALQSMVAMLLRRLDGYKNELGQLREALGMPATHQGEAGGREVEEDIENKIKAQAAAMAEFKGVLRRVREQIDCVSKYKELHEQLHNLQFLYNVIDDAVRNLPGNETVQDSLREYNIRFEGIVTGLQGIAGHAVFISAENVWVQKLCQVQKEFHDAVEHINVDQMKRGIRSIAQELAIRPVLINKSLTTAAHQLSITSLADAMNILEQKYNLINMSSNQIRQFKSKVDELEELHRDLTSLIDEHGTWQEVDIVLRRIEGNMQEILDEIELSWPDLKQKTIVLYLDGKEDWAQKFKEDSEKLEHSIAARDPKNVRSSFRNYRSRAEVRFFTVDKKLRDQCTSMSTLGTQLLEMME